MLQRMSTRKEKQVQRFVEPWYGRKIHSLWHRGNLHPRYWLVVWTNDTYGHYYPKQADCDEHYVDRLT